jgi:hypothetical protein
MLSLRRSNLDAADARSDGMSELDYDLKLNELDRLLNDPDSPMDPSKVWTLLAEVSKHERVAATAGLPAA